MVVFLWYMHDWVGFGGSVSYWKSYWGILDDIAELNISLVIKLWWAIIYNLQLLQFFASVFDCSVFWDVEKPYLSLLLPKFPELYAHGERI